MSFDLVVESFPPPSGPLKFAYVPWDSDLYGFPFYELICNEISTSDLSRYLKPWLSSLPYDSSCLVYSKIPTVAVSLGEILTRHRFYPLETLIELNLSLSQFKPVVTRSFSNRVLRLAREADLPQIMNIAGSAFKTDRLHLDPHLAPEKADQRYMQWVRRALINGEQIYVYEEITSGKLLGFMHIRNISSRIVNLSLASVNPFHKSIGAGILTFQGVLKQLRSQGYQIATTKCSINNLDILNLLISLRFRFSHAVQTFHWFQAGK